MLTTNMVVFDNLVFELENPKDKELYNLYIVKLDNLRSERVILRFIGRDFKNRNINPWNLEFQKWRNYSNKCKELKSECIESFRLLTKGLDIPIPREVWNEKE